MPVLWDALSGKFYRWNRTKNEAFASFLANMRLLQANAEANCPEGMPSFLRLRDFEMAYYSAWQTSFSNMMNEYDFQFRENFYTLNSRGMNLLIASFNFHFNFMRYGSSDERAWFRGLAYLMKHLFEKSDSYFDGWVQTFAWHDELGDNGALAARYNHKLYEEIAPLLGLPADTRSLLINGVYWGGMSITIAKVATYAVVQPGWRKSVEDWMAGRR